MKKFFKIEIVGMIIILLLSASIVHASLTFSNTGIVGDSSFNNLTISGIATGSTQCLHISSTGLVSGTGSDCGSGGVGGTWGSITGTLSAQTDLNTALTGKAASNASISVNGQTCVLGSTCIIAPGILISTNGPVSDPGGVAAIQYNNAAGALTFNAPAGVNGYQRCYRNATGKSGVVTVQMASSNTVDLAGANGTSAGTLVSGGALADAVCIVSDTTNHWYAYVSSGAWTNN